MSRIGAKHNSTRYFVGKSGKTVSNPNGGGYVFHSSSSPPASVLMPLRQPRRTTVPQKPCSFQADPNTALLQEQLARTQQELLLLKQKKAEMELERISREIEVSLSFFFSDVFSFFFPRFPVSEP